MVSRGQIFYPEKQNSTKICKEVYLAPLNSENTMNVLIKVMLNVGINYIKML